MKRRKKFHTADYDEDDEDRAAFEEIMRFANGNANALCLKESAPSR